MDPITIAITTAIAAGVASGVTEKVTMDVYQTLKMALKRKFGEQSDIVEAVDKLEIKPNSVGRQQSLQEEIEYVKADQDQELLLVAQTLLAHLKNQFTNESRIRQIVTNSQNVAQSVYGSVEQNIG